jgi:hypothetical protein
LAGKSKEIIKDVDQDSLERDLVNQMIGRIQLASGVSKLLTVGSLRDLEIIKKRKLYSALYKKTIILPNGETADVGTWAGFCKAIGLSKTKVDEDIQNLRAFGEEALEAMNTIGLGYRDLRKLRKLEDDDQKSLTLQIEQNAGDPAAIAEIIETLQDSYEKKEKLREWKAEQEKKAAEQVAEQANNKIGQLEAEKRVMHVQLEEYTGEDLGWAQKLIDEIDGDFSRLEDKLERCVKTKEMLASPKFRAYIVGRQSTIEDRILAWNEMWDEITGEKTAVIEGPEK